MTALWNNLKVVMLLLILVCAEVRLICQSTVKVEIKKAEANDILKEEFWTEVSPHV